MRKRLAILGHKTRGHEVIELLKMMGGSNIHNLSGNDSHLCYFIKGFKNEIRNEPYLFGNENLNYFTLEEFLEKYPFKIGDKVIDKADGCPGIVNEMKWDEDVSDMKYFVAFGNDIDFGWFANDSIEFCKETDTVKPVTNKSERTHEDVIFDSIIWHLRNSVNNGKQNLSGGECEDYFREVVKKNNENKMSDCKKCGLHFGSVRCFDKDCPHNAPKSYAVGLKDGKVIDCIANKETYMNEIKPLFKTGDVVKLKGCPDENIFWIVMDVVKDGYIFNDGIKYSFDDQHHYEKSNREIINAPDITAKVTDKNHKMGPKSKLPSKYYEEIQTKRDIDKSEFIIKHMILPNKMDDKLEYEIIDGYEFEKVENNKIILKPIKPKYPTNYQECCDVLGLSMQNALIYINKDCNKHNYYNDLQSTLNCFVSLKICRDAYWKIAGEEMGLDKPWEPQFENCSIPHYCMFINHTGEICYDCFYGSRCLLAFPTEEMGDVFYGNFKDLIEQCKELL